MPPLLADTVLAIGASPAASLVVKATLTVGLALLLVRLARRSRAAVRHVLLAAAFATLLLLPLASVLLPAMPVDVPVTRPAATGVPAVDGPVIVAAAPTPVNLAAVSSTPIASPGLAPRAVTAAAWGAGALLFLLPVIVGLWQTRTLRRCSVPWAEGRALARQLANDSGLRRPVDVRLHESLPGPMTYGILRPAIVLPRDTPAWRDEELRRALMHELEHVRRGDWAIHCAARTVCALYWFHPLVWLAWRQLGLEAERACDDAVVRDAEATAYAEQLVALAQRLSGAANRPMLAMAGGHDLATRVRALLDSAQSRGRASSACVATVAVAALALVAMMAPLRTVAYARASSAPAQEPALAFEVASVRKNTSGVVDEQFIQRQPGGRMTIRNFPLRGLIAFAYQIQPFQLQGGPAWLATDRFDIVAKAEGDPAPAPPWEPDPMRLMLRTLLAERFKLAIRKEVQDMPIFELLPASRDGKPGPQLRTAATDCVAMTAAAREAARTGAPPPPPRGPDGSITCGTTVNSGRIRMGGFPMSIFANTLSPLVRRVVVDRTGFAGTFDLELTYTPDPLQASQGGGPPLGVELPAADTNGPSLFTALQEQLALKLEPSRGPVEVLVIERAEQPTGN